MIELLSSNYFPLEWNGKTFIDTFYSMLNGARELSIATGYCSEESIAKLIGLLESDFNDISNYDIYDEVVAKLKEMDKRLTNTYFANFF